MLTLDFMFLLFFIRIMTTATLNPTNKTKTETVYIILESDRKDCKFLQMCIGEGYGSLDDGTFSPAKYLLE